MMWFVHIPSRHMTRGTESQIFYKYLEGVLQVAAAPPVRLTIGEAGLAPKTSGRESARHKLVIALSLFFGPSVQSGAACDDGDESKRMWS